MSHLQYADLTTAKQVLLNWSGDPASLQLLGNSASSVFAFRTTAGEKRILRLTDATFRTFAQVRGAVQFIQYLEASGGAVNQPVPTNTGAYALRCTNGITDFIAAAYTYIEGVTVNEQSPHWNEAFFKAWGTALGRLHAASSQYIAKPECPLWHYHEEILFKQKHQLTLPEDVASGPIIEATLAACQKLPKHVARYGIIHGDFGPQNFFFHPKDFTVTAIDFGNSCYHYFVSDLANIQLWLGRRQVLPNYWSALLRGYAKHHTLPVDLDEQLALFRRLRIQYIYLDRLYTAGPRDVLEMLREQVLAGATWL